MMDDNALDRLFSGDLDKLISLPKRVVRLFISSTFTDMMLERNSLMERVYPQLKKYCRERHGLDFQVVDMRWGVRDEATDDHQTVNLCSREIDNCQRMSLGPNFVALLGDKYGFRPICNRINSAEYRALRRCLIEVDISTDLLDTWYKEDLNALPPEYLLQPISSILRNFTNKNEPELQANDQRVWMATQERLHKLLVIGSNRLVQQGRMDKQQQLLKYSISVTEREVIEGCLDVANAKSCSIVYIRSIVDLRDHLGRCLTSLSSGDQNTSDERAGSRRGTSATDEQAVGLVAARMQKNIKAALRRRAENNRRLIGKYIDLVAGESTKQAQVWRLDEEAQKLLGKLKEVKLERKLAASGRSLTKYQVPWDEQEGLSVKREEHKQYISEFTDHFYTNLTKMIKKAASKNEQSLKSGLIGEVLQHSHYAKHASKSFHGRNEELDSLRSYILGAHPTGVRPMFVYGVGGSGKTSVLARAVCLAKNWISMARSQRMGHIDERWDQKPCIIMRFCCATPSSSSLLGVLTSVCHQLQYNFYQFGPLNGATPNDDRLNGNTMPQANPSAGNAGVDARQIAQPQLFYEPVPEDFVRLVFTFRQLLENCQHPLHQKRLFLIVIDSVERLTAPAESNLEVKHSWLTGIGTLPANVRLIVSCSSESAGTSTRPQSDYLHLKRHFLRVYLPFVDKLPEKLDADRLRLESFPELEEMDSFCGSETSSRSDISSKRGRHSLARDSLTRGMLKRLVVPAMRFRRSSEKTNPTNVANQQLARASSQQSLKELIPEKSDRPRSSSPDGLVRSLSTSIRAPIATNSRAPFVADSLPTVAATHRHTQHAKSRSPALRLVWMLHVRPMGVELAQGLLKRWLGESSRMLTHQQWSIVRKSFACCSRPIFVKLAFGEIVNWKSYSVQSDSKGLTFGSTLLESLSLDSKNGTMLMDNADLEPYLTALMRHHRSVLDEKQLKHQTIVMEQQWLTYLDYNQQKEEQRRQAELGEQQQKSQDGDLLMMINGQPASGRRTRRAAQSQAVNICHLSSTIDDAICQLFTRIELQHGFVLTKHSLSYITAARNGICENELEDILSLDDVVLDDVFQYHLPPVRRIPPLLWTRIRNDLPDYLSERDADGIVLNWHHSQFEEVTKKRYLNETRQQIYIHSTMADYFLGKWADVAKPFRCARRQLLMATAAEGQPQEGSQQLTSVRSSGGSGGASPTESAAGGRLLSGSGATRFTSIGGPANNSLSGRSGRMRSSDNSEAGRRLLWTQAKADRRVPQQPLHYGSIDMQTTGTNASSTVDRNHQGSTASNKRRRYNLRKLIELPYHLMRAGRFQDLANNVLFNYNWLHASLDALGLQSLLADFREAATCVDSALVAAQSSTVNSAATSSDLSARVGKSKSSSTAKDTSSELRSMRNQLLVLANTIRLSSSSIHLDPQMLAPQLIGRLLPLVVSRGQTARKPQNSRNDHQTQQRPDYDSDCHLLAQLLDQCDRDGCAHCSLLPTGHCLQAPDGLQLSSLEGHSFAIMSMAMTADQRHLLAVSNRLIMWDIATGEVSRDIEPQIGGSIMRQLKLGSNNEFAIAYTSANQLLALDILTHQVAKYQLSDEELKPVSVEFKTQMIRGLELVDKISASKFVVWTDASWFVFRLDKSHADGSLAAAGNQPHRVSIEREYGCSLAQLDLVDPQALKIVSVQQVADASSFASRQGEQQSDLALVTVASTGGSVAYSSELARHKLRLLTVAIAPSLSGGIHFQLWPHCQQPEGNDWAACMALEPIRLLQLVYATGNGDLYLSRRRRLAWSKPKLIRKAPSSTKGERSVERLTQSLAEQLDALVDESGSMVEAETVCAPLAAELESIIGSRSETGNHLLSKHDHTQQQQQASIGELERLVDGEQVADKAAPDETTTIDDAAEPTPAATSDKSLEPVGRLDRAASLTIKLYLSTRIVIKRFSASTPREHNLVLPRNLRNISVEPNECQIRSVILEDESDLLGQSLLVVSSGKRLLIYSLENDQFLKQLEAHSGRIVQLLPIQFAPIENSHESMENGEQPTSSNTHPTDERDNSSSSITARTAGGLCVASASMDKTVKVWNLANLNKEVHTLDKLDQALEFISLASQHPVAACLSRSEVGIWDWRTLKLHWRVDAPSLQRGAYSNTGGGSRILSCRLSSSGYYLCLATQTSLHLLTTAAAANVQANWHRSTARDNFCSAFSSQAFSHQLPANSSVLDVRFFLQDARLLTTIECNTDHHRSAVDEPTTKLTSQITILCHSLPDGHLLYTIDCTSPLVQTGAESRSLPMQQQQQSQQPHHHQARRRSFVMASVSSGGGHTGMLASGHQAGGQQRTRLKPVLTRDGLHVVALVATPMGDSSGNILSAERRQSGPLPTSLAVHSARDGILLRTIDLARLEPARPSLVAAVNLPVESRNGQVARRDKHQVPPTGPAKLLATAEAATRLAAAAQHHQSRPLAQESLLQTNFVSLIGDQFSRLKPVVHRDRHSVVALMDEESGATHLVDVHSRQLLASSSIWNGKLSSDGRYGLSRMFQSAGDWRSNQQAAGQQRGLDGLAATGGWSALDGLQLLEMQRLTPIKSLLTYDTLGQLLGASPAKSASQMAAAGSGGAQSDGDTTTSAASAAAAAAAAATGSQADITCGFAGPGDAYVYYHDSRLMRLLLIRIRDAQLVANYKLSSRAIKIKVAPGDGQALILGLADGSLTTLAIVDPQSGDSLAHLAQYPSRRR